MWPTLLLAIYSLFILGVSCAGGWLPTRWRISHTRMQLIMSFVAGLMLGVSLLHLIPHSAAETGALDRTMAAVLVGLLVMFFLIRTFHIHHHDTEEVVEPDGASESVEHHHSGSCQHDHHHHAESSAHQHGTDHGSAHGAEGGHRYSWVGLFLGLALHTMIDGMALGASVAADAEHSTGWGLFGISTFLAVALHKPLDALSISSLMLASGWSSSRRNLVNLLFAMMCPIGAAAVCFGFQGFLEEHHGWLGAALGFSAGVFLCISLGDLLPEVHFHSHDRAKLSACLLAGVTLAYVVGFLEPHGAHAPHDHSHASPPPAASDAHGDHDAHGHDHKH